MTEKRTADDLVAVRSQNLGRYRRNFIRQVVCEFRFPTLLDLGTEKPPASLVKALRKDYPVLDTASEVRFSIGSSAPDSRQAHVFRSVKGDWAVSLKDDAIALESKNYPGFDVFRERAKQVVEAAAGVIDSDFFTRIGIRYINVVDKGDPMAGWINPALVAPLSSKAFAGVNEYSGKLQLLADDGGCLLQHALAVTTRKDGGIHLEYTIDIDCYRNETVVVEALDVVDKLHAQGFDIFDWALGPAARDHLSADKVK